MSADRFLSPTPTQVFKDFDLSFAANPVTGDLVTRDTVDSVKQRIRVLLLTNFYERPFDPVLGCNITAQLFRLAMPEVEHTMRQEIIRVLRTYEPGASLLKVQVGYDGLQTIEVRVTFKVIGLAELQTFTQILERAR